MQNCSNDNYDDYNVFSSPLHYPDDGNNNQKDSCVGDSGSGLMREIEMDGDHFPRYWLSFTRKHKEMSLSTTLNRQPRTPGIVKGNKSLKISHLVWFK